MCRLNVFEIIKFCLELSIVRIVFYLTQDALINFLIHLELVNFTFSRHSSIVRILWEVSLAMINLYYAK